MNKDLKYILAFDTSMSACSAGLYDQNNVLVCEKHEEMNRGQAERLMPMIDEVISKADLSYKDISLIASTHGPGAFTGLRLSLATAKALSLSLKIPAIGISTLEAVFYSLPPLSKNVLVCLETKRKDFYTQLFSHDGKSLTYPQSISADKVKALIEKYNPVIAGDTNERLCKDTDFSEDRVDIKYPATSALTTLALKNYDPDGSRLQNMEPLYLRDADVSFPATKK